MKTYLKPALRIMSFFIGLLLLIILTSYIFIPKDNREEAGMDHVSANGILGEKENSIDVLIVGDSLSYCSFSPMLMWQDYGFTSYVCGTSAQPVYDSYLYIEKAFQNQTPSMVILEVNTIFRETTARNYFASKVKDLIPVFQYHDRWKSMTLRDFGSSVDYTWTSSLKGYKYKTGINPGTNLSYMDYSDKVESIPETSLMSLHDIMRICNEHNVPLMLVSAPCMKHWSYAKHNAIAAFAEENGIDYLDMNLLLDELQLDWATDTLDKGDHLNHDGAVKVSVYFGKYLQEKLALPDHRMDQQYASWNEALEAYKDKVGQNG